MAHNSAYELHQANIWVAVGAEPVAPTIMYGDGAPTDGTAGTGVGNHPGSLYIDTTNGIVYVNGNTAASPAYIQVGDQTA